MPIMFWITALSLAAIAALIVALPLFRAGDAVPSEAVNDAEVYRDQLDELGRDETAGLLNGEEAREARAEIARRLIATSEAAENRGHPLGRIPTLLLAAFLVLFMPVAGLALYNRMGNPTEPDQPLAGRLSSPQPDINILIAKTENHLKAHPDDGKAWELLAPIYMRSMRGEEAATAWKNAIRYSGPSGERLGSYGEALTAVAQGNVSKEAEDAFRQALAIDPKDPRARFYVALAAAQTGRFDEAIAAFKALKADSPADAPWQGVVDTQIAQTEAAKAGDAKAPGNPTASDIDAASGMNAEDRMAMIRTMVEGLDERLKTEPNNFDGWMRLVRSYGVLGEPDKAAEALKRGLAVFPADSDNGKALLALAKDMGLSIDGVAQ